MTLNSLKLRMVLPTIKEIIMKNKIKIITIFLLFTLLLTGCASLTEVDIEIEN